MTYLRRRDERILEPAYMSREGSTGTTWWVANRGRKKLTKFVNGAIVGELGVERAGQVVFSSDSLNTGISVVLPGVTIPPPIGVRVIYTGFSGPIGSYINRTVPTPPTASADSIRVSGTYPSSISWDITGLAGGTATHPTQTNSIEYFENINGGFPVQTFSQSWKCILTLLSGETYRIEIQPFPNSASGAWGYVSAATVGQTVSGGSRTITLSTTPYEEAYVNGGTFTLAYLYA